MTPITSPGSVIGASILFLFGAVIMRGAGCAINDLWDRNLDPHVARTRLRPLARGAITPLKASIFTGVNLLTILYDMVYAYMDVKEDVGADVRSITIKHNANTKIILTGLLTRAGGATGAGITFYAISCGGATLTLGAMIKRVRLKDPGNIWWWFCNNCWMTGGVISLGLAIEYSLSYIDDQSEESLD
ncbi:4-hydroxybenzoate hexaprenyltransferase [Fusarium denticulatum]|uniref:4-hydroxybenzoate hexaprenyltransferase n=1 Tax=Fusarium denticulatum TaxID=48507 RepID=A0A8H5X738_9HYPO|nr:4-hydroxybenzoate hexaprenyltransferase [Fusarium denticulatum]